MYHSRSYSDGGFLNRSRQTQEMKEAFAPAIPPKMIGFMDEDNSMTDQSYELPSYMNDHLVSNLLHTHIYTGIYIYYLIEIPYFFKGVFPSGCKAMTGVRHMLFSETVPGICII